MHYMHNAEILKNVGSFTLLDWRDYIVWTRLLSSYHFYDYMNVLALDQYSWISSVVGFPKNFRINYYIKLFCLNEWNPVSPVFFIFAPY